MIGLMATSLIALPANSEEIRIGYQKSSTLTAILKTNGELEKALTPLGITVNWRGR
jgi:sulfonate transport system substrate-binding protein